MIKPCKNLFLVEGLSLVDTGFDIVRRQVHKPHMSFDPRLITGLSLWHCEKLLFAMSSTMLLSNLHFPYLVLCCPAQLGHRQTLRWGDT